MILYPYKTSSKSAKTLKEALGIKFAKRTGKPIEDLVINWGCYFIDREYKKILNPDSSVAFAVNKLKAFEYFRLNDIPVPFHCHEKKDIVEGIFNGPFLARTVINGHSGQGIVVVNPGDPIPDAPLYVEYIPKDGEYRVHVGSGKVLDIQRKKKRNGGVKNHMIRSHANGWVFCRENINPPEGLGDLAIRAVNALGLDFGAVDIIYNKQRGLFVLEVNTAPGLEGKTLEIYSEYFKSFA